MKLPLNQVRPGMVLWDATASPYVLDVEDADQDVVHTLTFEYTGKVALTTGRGTDQGRADLPVVVTSKPPRVLMSWNEEHQVWAILVDTTNGSGRSQLNIALNDAELFDGVTDP